ncbi:MAG: site-specific DNA-methyltransferase [Bacteroidaceae bacterium]|nr:site-specific DNA-methyltransferase [Bacteroidaceae bacterium]
MFSFYEKEDYTLYHGDSFQLLKDIKENVDMIFADPPYFLSKGFTMRSKGRVKCFDKGEWDRERPLSEINDFNKKWLLLCRERLKDNGSIWVSGTYHNIYSVANCMVELGYKILNIIVWNKPDAPLTLSNYHFNFSAEYIIWARKSKDKRHYFNNEIMTYINGGKRMSDVWNIPTTGLWEKSCGKHPTQKPLRLLYRIILASTKEGDLILDPFAGSCTTGIAANLLGRKFIGYEQSEEFIKLGVARRNEIEDAAKASKLLRKMSENPNDVMVMINHARKELKNKMIETGICYLRAGDSKGSLCVTPGFERMQYVLLHTAGEDVKMFRLKTKGHFQIWTKKTLEQYGFQPEHATYYVVLLFDKNKEIPLGKSINVKERINTYRARIRPLSDFVGIK